MVVIMKRKGFAMMLMIVLVVTQVECITPSQEFVSIKQKGFCERIYEVIFCKYVCYTARNIRELRLDVCIVDCVKENCEAPVETKTLL